MHDPTALFRFQEHDIFLPMVVLEELDRGKKGMSEVARNVRQVSRFLDQLMCNADKAEIDAGLPIQPTAANGGGIVLPATGRLFFQTEPLGSQAARASPARHRSRTTTSSAPPRPCASCAPTARSSSSPRTSTCASRPRCSASRRRTIPTTRSWTTPTSSTPGLAALAGRLLGAPRQVHRLLEGGGPHLLPRPGPGHRRLVSQPVPVPGRRRRLRGHGARETHRDRGHHRAGRGLPPARATTSGASTPATASRTSRSTC